ncbi:MAG: hypothetical protein HFJ20_06825 [Clostridia bacterium]|nr:hypothetical protein [Clostridia bacterium]
MKYSIKKTQPCADYGKITLEGEFEDISKNKLLQNLKEEFTEIKNISKGKIIIAKNNYSQIYLYDENRFVMNNLINEEYGRNVLDKILK